MLMMMRRRRRRKRKEEEDDGNKEGLARMSPIRGLWLTLATQRGFGFDSLEKGDRKRESDRTADALSGPKRTARFDLDFKCQKA